MPKHSVYLCQVNNQYGDNVFLPNSVGMVQAYCQSIEEINKQYDFKGFIYLRENPEEVAKRLENPRVVGISCYIWNWEYSRTVAHAIKAQHPDCLIVMGGPQVPLKSEGFFEEHPYVDLLVHYEGEMPFADILLETVRTDKPDYTQIPGISVRVEGTRCLKTLPRERNLDLSKIPSPYLTGVFDDLIKAPYAFHASQETHRGCPYSCTFCDWGSATMNKVRAFSDDRLHAEFEWFGRHKIDLLYNCDANYGLLPRDYALTTKMVETKRKFGYPAKFRAAYAKNSSMKVFEIAKLLNDADMCKGVTLSFQSMDNHTLQVIKRFNIKVTDFKNLMRMYRGESIPTYSEIIIGLPGESYDTFADGLNTLISSGQHDSLNIYTCAVLPNAEMGKPEYRAEHGIKTVHVPVLLTHSTPSSDLIVEYNDMVYETKTMPREDWIRTYLFAWATQCFHCLSLTQFLSVFLHTEFEFPYRAFYEKLIEFAQKHPNGPAGRQYALSRGIVENVLKGGRWDMVIPKFGNISWPTEEGAFLNLIAEKDAFYEEMAVFIQELCSQQPWNMDATLLKDLLSYQAHIIIDPNGAAQFTFDLSYNLHEYFQYAYLGEKIALSKVPTTLEVEADEVFGGDLETYARKVVWYGRKGGQFRYSKVQAKLPSQVQ